MQLGALTASAEPSLPDEITVAMPVERRLSIAALRESLSQLAVNEPPPRLMFTDAIRIARPQRDDALEALDLVAREAEHARASGRSPQALPVEAA